MLWLYRYKNLSFLINGMEPERGGQTVGGRNPAPPGMCKTL